MVATPNLLNHALPADKRNLSVPSDLAMIEGRGRGRMVSAHVKSAPRNLLVTNQGAIDQWIPRKGPFFKPTGGHGGKAVCCGDKVTKGVWSETKRGDKGAQDMVRQNESMIRIDDHNEARSMGFRL